MAISLKYATLAQVGNEFRRRYKESSGSETWRLANWILNRIADGTVTDAQVRSFFGLTSAQYTTLKTKWQDMQTKWQNMQAAAGE